MKSTTPKEVGKNVFRLREKLGLSTEPVFVPVRDTEGYKVADCFYNVPQKIAKDGGSIQYGWTVWEHSGRLIEGEFHAVWVDPNGAFLDITPKPDGESHILFFPDPNRIYENIPVDNVRLLLTNKLSVVHAIREQERLAKLRIKYNVDGTEWRVPVSELPSSMTGGSSGKEKVGRNERCPCGSGKKFKICHGK